jgi:hypothetical protein
VSSNSRQAEDPNAHKARSQKPTRRPSLFGLRVQTLSDGTAHSACALPTVQPNPAQFFAGKLHAHVHVQVGDDAGALDLHVLDYQ